MKRYLLFAGTWHYPKGGIDDFKASYDSLDDAKAEGNRLVSEDVSYVMQLDWFHVVDSVGFSKVAEGERKEGN